MARSKRRAASSSSFCSFCQALTLSERAVLSFSISFVSSGVSQKPFLEMMASISLRRFSLPSTSKIILQLFQLVLK